MPCFAAQLHAELTHGLLQKVVTVSFVDIVTHANDDYLVNAMERYLDRIQMDKNQEARRAAMQRGLGISALNVNTIGDSSRGAVGASSGGGGGVAKRPCYFHNHGGCTKSAADGCFAHLLFPAAEWAQLVQPSPHTVSRSRAPLLSAPHAPA